MDADKRDPSDQSGRPWIVSGAALTLVVVLVVLLVVGLVLT